MDFIERINSYILNPHTINTRKRTAYYPSEASIISRVSGEVIGKCHRAVYYDWVDTTPSNPIDSRGQWTLEFGLSLESMYIEYAKRCGIWAGDHVKFYDNEHNISGEVDLFIFEPKELDTGAYADSDDIAGTEIKTAYGYGFQKNVKTAPKIENLLQVAVYIKHFELPWKLIYHSRDTMENLLYNISIDKDDNGEFLVIDNTTPVKVFYIEDIYERYRQLGEYIINNKIPPRDYVYGYTPEQTEQRAKDGIISQSKFRDIKNKKCTDSDWQCLYCKYLDLCWKEKREQILK